jgi:predicted outer membrane repeat protein
MKARWLHRLVETLRTATTGGKEKHRRDRARSRPRFEQLEDRLTPATFVVNSPLDFVAVNLATGQDALGRTSLRSAIQAANARPSDDTILLPGGVFTLTRAGAGENAAATGDLDVHAEGKLTIVGPAAGATIIDAAGLDRVFDVFGELQLVAVTVRGGNSAASPGGGIHNTGTLSVTLSIVAANIADTDGGGIANLGTLTVTHSIVSGNSASEGGGIHNDRDSTTTVSDSTFTGNSAVGGYGGGIFSGDFSDGSGSTLTVSDSTFTGNSAADERGGGIYNSGSDAILTVIGSTFIGNSAGGGGGIGNTGMLTVTGSTLSNNSDGGGGGGGLHTSGAATVSDCTLNGNSAENIGGGILNNGTLTLSRSTLSGNSAVGGGGAIFNSATLTVRNSTLTGNSTVRSGGGIRNHDNGPTLTVINSTLTGNSAGDFGGGIANGTVVGGTLTVAGSTLSGNSAGGGGGIASAGTSTVLNSTLSGNTAAFSGGGIRSDGTLTVTGSTLTGNSAGATGGGIVVESFSDFLTVGNTIVAGNTANVGPDVRGFATSTGNNLIGNTAGSSGFFGPGDLRNLDARLGPLSNNGGPTLTHALLAGSPALDAGSNAGAPLLDQRGFNRFVDGPDANTSATADIGAFEAQIWLGDTGLQTSSEDATPELDFVTSLGIANVTARSSNPALIPDSNLAVSGAGAGRTLTMTPLANQSGTALITITVSDGTASMTDTFVLNVSSRNDAPVLEPLLADPRVMTLQAINEDDTSSFGTRVSDMLLSFGTDRITDVDAGAVEGIAVTLVDNANGDWQFSIDSAATFTSFGTVSEQSARLLTAGDFVRFVPAADFHGKSTITFRAWDQTSGFHGDTADTSTNGNATAFSIGLETASITILSVNDAPRNTVPAGQKVAMNKPLAFSATRRLSIADIDAGTGIVRVTLTVTNGKLTLGGTAGLSVTGNRSARITLAGTVQAINAALAGLRFNAKPRFRGKAKLTIFTEDLGNAGLGGAKTASDVVSIAVL